jgi:hypothetical protein
VRRTDTSEWPCNIARSAHVLGDHWNILLIRQACLGMRRYEDLQRALGIGRNMLTLRLTSLVDEGILERVVYQREPGAPRVPADREGPRRLHRPRGDGRLGPAMARRAEGSPVLLHHGPCDHDMHAVVVCSECREPIDVREVTARAAPGAEASPAPRQGD